MINIRVWNVESDQGTQAVKFLDPEFLRSKQLGHIAIRSTGRSALRKCHRKGAPLSDSLKKAIQHYLKQDDYIIFVFDPETSKSVNQRLGDHLKCVVKDNNFSDKVFFALDVQESESNLPMMWQDIVSDFRTEVESDRKKFRKEWDNTLERFHDAFADTPEEEVIRDFEEALAEVRRERA